MDIKKIVLTGGPCAGKTTSLSRIQDYLEKKGYRVYKVPEMASILFNGGITRSDLGDNYYCYGFQEELMRGQIYLEQTFLSLAREVGEPAIILCDRGLMDGKAFLPESLWSQILDGNSWTEVGLRDKHYDAVIHLTTAAIGAKEFYTLENNSARIETAEEAADIDNKIKECWIGHPKFRVIDNSTDFEGKVNRVLSSVCELIGIPESLEIEKKFLVKEIISLPKESKEMHIIQDYYQRDGESFRIRSRGENDNYIYTLTSKKEHSSGDKTVRVETEKKINPRDIYTLTRGADHCGRIEKYRTCFLYKGQYFELDDFVHLDLKILELEMNSLSSSYSLPDFIKIEKEVTDDEKYLNKNLAKKFKE